MAGALDLPLTLWLGAAAILFFGYLVFGMTGFGSSILVVPMLAHYLPVPFIVSMILILDSVATVWMGVKYRREFELSELKWLVPFSVIGMVIGVTLLVKLPEALLLGSLGVFSVAVGVYTFHAPEPRDAVRRVWSIPAGLAGGAFTALFSSGGPVYAAYLSRRIQDVERFRATIATVVALLWVVRVFLFTLAGLLLQIKVVTTALTLAPAMIAGLLLGMRTNVHLKPLYIRRAVATLILLAGVSIIRNLV